MPVEPDVLPPVVVVVVVLVVPASDGVADVELEGDPEVAAGWLVPLTESVAFHCSAAAFGLFVAGIVVPFPVWVATTSLLLGFDTV